MDWFLIVANILSLVGNLLFTLSSIFKSKRKIVLFQSSNYVLAVISEYMTKAYSGMIQEGMSLIRNIILLFVNSEKKIIKLIITLICVLIAVSVGIYINYEYSDNVWYGYLPVLGTVVYSTAVILAFMLNVNEIKCELIIKIGLTINCFIWMTYGFFVKLYPILIFNIITVILCIISFVRIAIIVKENKKLAAE